MTPTNELKLYKELTYTQQLEIFKLQKEIIDLKYLLTREKYNRSMENEYR